MQRFRRIPYKASPGHTGGGRSPQGLAPLCKGSWQGRQALTEGLWVSYRNGLTVTGYLLLHRAYNPSASHSLSTSPYTGEARGGRRSLAPHRFTGQPSPAGGRRTRDEKPSPAADAGLGYCRSHPLRGRTGGSGGHFALGIKAPRRPFCPLSAGGKWTNAPPRKRGGGPVSFDRLGRRTQRLPAA